MRTMLSIWQGKLVDRMNRLTLAIWSKRAYQFAYDALDRPRTRKPHAGLGSSEKSHLTRAAARLASSVTWRWRIRLLSYRRSIVLFDKFIRS